jgi:ATP-binding cassette subfamily B protein
MKTQKAQKAQVLKALWPYVYPYRWKVCLALFILLLDTLTNLAAPWGLKLIFDNVLLNNALQSPWAQLIPPALAQNRTLFFIALCGAMLLLALIGAGASYLGMRMLAVIGQRMIFELRCKLFTHLQQLSSSFYDRQRMGDLLTRMTSDVQSIQDALVTALPVLLLSLLLLSGIIGILFLINPVFGVISMVIACSLFLVLRRYLRAIKLVARKTRTQEGDSNAVAQEHLLGIRVVQAFGMEAQGKQRYEESMSRALLLGMVSAHLQSGLPSMVDLTTDLGTLVVLGVGGVLVMLGKISIGDLLVFNAYLRTMYSPLRQISKLGNTLTRAQASAERVLELLETRPDITNGPEAQPAPALQGFITFDRVSFGYDPANPILHDLSFRIKPGMMVALVGRTGAGKSSILHLLQHFYEPQQGEIRIDGQDIRSYTLASLRQQIALVPQDPMLFRASIRENIAYGRPDSSEEEIIAAAQAANAYTFISRLPQGFDTILEERGIGLSGGERQRIAIARAMVRRAPILLLDEPTVGLDAQSEESVVEALERLMQGCTTIVSAHRLSTIQKADLILVIDQGRIVEMGTPVQLLRRRGQYYRLHSLQLHTQTSVTAVHPAFHRQNLATF